MKKRNIFISLGLAAAMVFGVGTALVLGSKSAPKEAKADDPDTWMMHFSLKSGEIAGYLDEGSMWVQTYTEGVGNSKWFQMYPISSGSEFFAVNATFPEEYSYNRIQYKFSQGGVEKWGVPYTTTASKESHAKMLYSTSGSWSGDNWNFSVSTYPEITAEYNDNSYYLAEDPANKRFIASSLISDGSDYYTFYYRASWDCTWNTLTTSSKAYFSFNHGDHYGDLLAGTYDVILKNNNEDGGIVELKKHEAASSSYIYYVTNSGSATTDYIYSWGGSEQFTSFPGTAITAVTGVEEVTGNGVLHFQDNNDPKLIYKIPITTGYPVGDSKFAFNNGTDAYKSDERAIELGKTYWWTGSANADASVGLEFLIALEAKRNGATNTSVCNISKSDAKDLVDAYNDKSASIRATYIDCSKVYTHKVDKTSGEELVTVRKIMEQLSEIAEEPLVDAANPYSKGLGNVSNTALIIVVAASIAVISAAGAFFIIRRRKHQ